MDQVIVLDVALSEFANTLLSAQQDTSIIQFIDTNDRAIDSTVEIPNTSVVPLIAPQSVTTQNSFGTPKLNSILYADSYESALAFGTSKINMKIDDVPFPSITSTVVIPNPSVKFIIKPLSIATTVNFGTASFIDNIHRLLVFKNDNISKVGENDAVVIAGGIRINPSSTVSGTATSGSATLPNNPAGFMSVTIGGIDYLMPYYNV